MVFKRIAAVLLWLLVTLTSAFGFVSSELETASGDFFCGTLEDAGRNDSPSRFLCRINGWLNYDTLSECAVAANKIPIWSPGKTGNAVENAFGHFKKHGSEFPEFQNSKQYVEGAKKFFSDPPTGALTKTRANGDKLFYDPPSNTFGVQAADGAPKTMFRPDKGIDYWNKQ